MVHVAAWSGAGPGAAKLFYVLVLNFYQPSELRVLWKAKFRAPIGSVGVPFRKSCVSDRFLSIPCQAKPLVCFSTE